jgi:hypothetical protein
LALPHRLTEQKQHGGESFINRLLTTSRASADALPCARCNMTRFDPRFSPLSTQAKRLRAPMVGCACLDPAVRRAATSPPAGHISDLRMHDISSSARRNPHHSASPRVERALERCALGPLGSRAYVGTFSSSGYIHASAHVLQLPVSTSWETRITTRRRVLIVSSLVH